MRVQGFEKRIERAELAAKGQSKYCPACICFPENEPPFFAFEIELEMLTRVKCPLHGERFKPMFRLTCPSGFGLSKHNISGPTTANNTEKPGLSSFPPELWPATEEEDGNGRVILRLKDGSEILAAGIARVSVALGKSIFTKR